jgi:hypothetical protein
MAIKRCPADAAFSTAVRMSRGNTCEHCGRQDGQLELSHIYGRRAKSVRWDTLNGLCLCHHCHMVFTENPIQFTQWLQQYVGQGYLDILNEKRNQIFKTTQAIRKDIAKHYRAQIKLMEAGQHDLVSYQ